MSARLSGPKEWSPGRPPKIPGLSTEENKRLWSIWNASKKGDSSTSEDGTWLVGIVQRLASRAPDDYDFKTHVALLNPIAHSTFPMRYVNSLPFHIQMKHAGFSEKTALLEILTQDQPTDATLLVRPFVRIMPGTISGSDSLLRRGTISMEIDGEIVLHTPIDEHLILEDGSFPRKERWRIRNLGPRYSVFYGCPVGVDAHKAFAGELEGFMCPNASMIRLFLHHKEPYAALTMLTSGIVAARYSMKDMPTGPTRVP